MAKAKTAAIFIDIAQVFWAKKYNYARLSGDYGNTKELMLSMVERGWLADDNGAIRVEAIRPEQQEEAIRVRTEQWENLKAAAKASNDQAPALVLFEELFTRNGKIIAPDYIGVTGNRRASVFFQAMLERRKANLPVTEQVTAFVCSYESDVERILDQANENNLKTAGFAIPSDVDQLLSAKKAVEFGASQADLRRHYKDGTGQKLWGVITLNRLFPGLRIIERMIQKPDSEGYISLKSVVPKDCPTLVMRADPVALNEKNAKLITAGKDPLKPLTESELEMILTGSLVDKANAPKVMKGENVRSLANEFPCEVIRDAFRAVETNSTQNLQVYHTTAIGFNAMKRLVTEGDYPIVEQLLLKVVNIPRESRGTILAGIVANIS